MSTETIIDQDEAVDLAGMDIPLTEDDKDMSASQNVEPDPLPELYDDNGKQVPYIAELSLGKEGSKKGPTHAWENGKKTERVTGVYFKVDVLAKVIGVSDGRELDLNKYDVFQRAPRRSRKTLENPASSFTNEDKKFSDIIAIARAAGIVTSDFGAMGEIVDELTRLLSKKTDRVQVLLFNQWQFYSKLVETPRQDGSTYKGKVVVYGMKNAQKNEAGLFLPVYNYAPTSEKIKARSFITKLAPLA